VFNREKLSVSDKTASSERARNLAAFVPSPPATVESAPDPTWSVSWERSTIAAAAHEATVFTLSNGYIAIRGTHPEDADLGLPGTPIAGIYADDRLGFRTLVTCDHWLGVSVRAAGRTLSPRGADVVAYTRCFDLRRGCVTRTLTWAPTPRAALGIETTHFASRAHPRLALQRYVIRGLRGAVDVVCRATVTARVRTRGEYLLAGHRTTRHGPGCTTISRTRDGGYRVARHAVAHCDDEPVAPRTEAAGAAWTVRRRLRAGQTLTLVKYVGFATSRDGGPDWADVAAATATGTAEHGFDAALADHVAAWQALWREADLVLDGDPPLQLATRYTVAQLLSHAAPEDDTVSLAAKPLSAEGYRGHVFWDTDLFMAPAITALAPELGRNLINYRHHTLDGARRNARRGGFRGAWYPWESADDGTEVTPRYWLRSDGRRMPITCWKYEIHSVCGVAYAAWDYYLATGDEEWLLARGVEILLETARFWASRAVYVPRRRRYEIHNVCGPDECHEHVDNSAYINVLAQWNIARALDTLARLRQTRPAAARALLRRLKLDAGELATVRRVGRRLYIPRDRATGWYRQFDGFEHLRFIDPATALERFANPVHAERTQVVKQADVIMLLYLLRDRHTRNELLANWDYYLPRTQHNTSLSAGTHAAVAARIGLLRTAVRFFTEAVNMDLRNRRGDSDRGLHGAALGGAICALLFGFGGLHFQEEQLVAEPTLPPGWRRLRLPFCYQGRRLRLDVTPAGYELRFRARGGGPVTVVTGGRRQVLRPGRVVRGPLQRPWQE